MDWSSDVCSSDLKASVWYYFREKDFASVRSLFETGNEIADAAAQATGTTVKRRLLGYAAPNFGNKTMEEAAYANIQGIGRTSGRERMDKYVEYSGYAGSLRKIKKNIST